MTDWQCAIVGGFVSISGVATPAMADADGLDGHFHGHMWGGGWGFIGGGMMFVFWVLTILAIVVAVRWVMNQSETKSGGDDADAVRTLRNRLANGEIDIEEFEARKRALES